VAVGFRLFAPLLRELLLRAAAALGGQVPHALGLAVEDAGLGPAPLG
jgi:hypothetical protein